MCGNVGKSKESSIWGRVKAECVEGGEVGGGGGGGGGGE